MWKLVLIGSVAVGSVLSIACETNSDCIVNDCQLMECNVTSGFCVDAGTTLGVANRCEATVCIPKFCSGGTRDGEFCSRADDCPSGLCVAGICDGGNYDGTGCLPSLSRKRQVLEEFWWVTSCTDGGGTCTASASESGGLTHLELCDDGKACTLDPCNLTQPTQALRCLPHTLIDCSDGNLCNGVETCDNSTGCVAGTPLSCPVDLCTGAGPCDQEVGCLELNPLDCDDSLSCSVDSCNSELQSCQHDYVPCQECLVDADCNDENPATSDFCLTGRCSVTGTPCGASMGCLSGQGTCEDYVVHSCVHVIVTCPGCVEPKGYWKNHKTDFEAALVQSPTNWICYPGSGNVKPWDLLQVNSVDNTKTGPSRWHMLYIQYVTALTDFFSHLTNPTSCPGSKYFPPEVLQCIIDSQVILSQQGVFPGGCISTGSTSAEAATPGGCPSGSIPVCTTTILPKLNTTANVTRALACQTILENFNSGNSSLHTCTDAELIQNRVYSAMGGGGEDEAILSIQETNSNTTDTDNESEERTITIIVVLVSVLGAVMLALLLYGIYVGNMKR